MADVSGQLRVHLSPALEQAPAMDLLCTQFVLTLTARNGNRFNWRRDVNSLMALAGRHLVWPEHVLLRLRGLLVEFKVNSAAEAYAMMADVAGVSAREVADALGRGSRLERIGMVDNLVGEHAITDLSDLMKVSDQLPSMLMREYRSEQELMAEFTRLAVPTTLQAEDFAHVAQDVQAVTRLLQAARERRDTGINILLYGPPGTGKTELAKVAVQAAGLDCFEVEYADRDGNALSGRDRYRSLQIAQAFLKESPRTALLFDEVEDVFPPVQGQTADLLARQEQLVHGGGSVNGKAWVNQILESNPVPVLWVTNRIEQIDPAFRRRFTYHLELSSPPPGARERLVRKLLTEVPVSDAFVSRLTERENLTPAQIANALRFANLVEHEDASQLEAWMERQLAHADLALGHRPQGTRQRRSVTQYDLDMLNVETRYPIARMVEALHARGHGTLCFYGAPGTGKTALAEYIAGQLGKPLMVKQASDLVSKYVGDTEQNMARMFADADRDEAVLLLDEADSFLMDRRGAQRNYEVTEVNEMLQGMERFQGIFICTTNLMDRVDQAALRRFSFKIQFKPLTLEQRERMFVTEALQGDAERLTPELRQRLARMDQLCPGDYAAVRRQIDILGEELFPEEFIEQLEAEHRIKPEVRESRGMGFV
ncbi:AAA family ATPase [Brachymonas denitrificans]|uniref:AAA family ATPase n=1 Tax=Brachymonas denitrificans TaxID=28220 RepID=UPI002AFF0BC8|nr:AAA family ATPase [Brachymonas denitrificans]